MTTSESLPEVIFTADPAIWLRGPSPDETEQERRDWVLGAQHAVATDFDLETSPGGADYRQYVSEVLTVFASWRTPADVTFLRLRHQGDTPVPVSVELYSPSDLQGIVDDPALELPTAGGSPAERLVAALLADPDDVPTVGEISREPVEDSRWQRLVYWVEDPEDGVTGRVRLVRHFERSGVVVVLRLGGLDPARTLEALDDVDGLARGIAVGGES